MLKKYNVFLFFSTALLIMCFFIIQNQWSVENIREVIRVTARYSLFLFLTAYAAHALQILWPSKFTSWILQKRRQFGLSFVFSHTVHAIAIYTFSQMDSELFHKLTPTANFFTGGLAYLILWTMGATSFDAAIKWMGAKRWSLLHTWGNHYLWLSFLVSFGKRIPVSSMYIFPVVLLIVIQGLRIWAKRIKKNK